MPRRFADVIKELGGTAVFDRLQHSVRRQAAKTRSTIIDAAYRERLLAPSRRAVNDNHCRRPQGHRRYRGPCPWAASYVKKAKIGRAVMDADVFIIAEPFQRPRGHVGFGGALKNIGMGCGSRAGKMEQHSSGKPSVDQSHLPSAVTHLPAQKLRSRRDKLLRARPQSLHRPQHKCVGCGRCIGACNFDAVS
jgi:ferredoxin